jgi:hypothetical protein
MIFSSGDFVRAPATGHSAPAPKGAVVGVAGFASATLKPDAVGRRFGLQP